MSKWKYNFTAEGGLETVEDVIDLVDDLGLDATELEKLTEKELEEVVSSEWKDWFFNQFNGGWSRVEDEQHGQG